MRASNLAAALYDQINAAVHILRNGGVVAIPTDTLYGLAASPFDDSAIERVFRLKGRSTTTAIPLLLEDADDVSRWALDVPELTWDLARRFWPGPLTLVLRRSGAVPEAVCGGGSTVGLRVPDHLVPRAIAGALGSPITGTSANRTGRPGLTTPEAVRSEFGDEVDLVIDGADAPGGLPSTVLDLTSDQPRMLRPGAVPAGAIEAVCGCAVAS